MDLEEKLRKAAVITDQFTYGLYDRKDIPETGHIPTRAEEAIKALLRLKEANIQGPSLEIGCGVGVWANLAAVAEYDSYACDINPGLIGIGREIERRLRQDQLISESTVLQFSCGNMLPPEYRDDYDRLVHMKTTRPPAVPGSTHIDPAVQAALSTDAYAQIIPLASANIIFCYPWPEQDDFLTELLCREASAGAYIAKHTTNSKRDAFQQRIKADILENRSAYIAIGQKRSCQGPDINDLRDAYAQDFDINHPLPHDCTFFYSGAGGYQARHSVNGESMIISLEDRDRERKAYVAKHIGE
jgi:hypothetical protein